ncbi:2TM domain-containing protein [Lewinella sp. 4G2]|uniref:2TM domain-containing protein n=1 Tax=Lewinella sp. 4G2 TaxID=1803372 RepID=UPI0007B4E90A|nr:2TM domain-containing protein [Lewinella sp. 4G2]OAV45173.1 hypothetical protein A3850_012020 [Lewinella sp. 4G2]
MRQSDEDLYEKAAEKVKNKKSFFYHLFAYVCTLGLFYALMYFENNGEILPVLIIGITWGIGLISHYYSAFGAENLGVLGIDEDWEEDALEKEIDRLKRKRELREELRREKELAREEEQLKLRELNENYNHNDLI